MIQFDNTELFYLKPLIHRWKNYKFNSDYNLFQFKNIKNSTLKTKHVNDNDIIPNFSRKFFNTWKETVDNWQTLFHTNHPIIENGKISSNICSVTELINIYKNQIKVNDCYINKQKYKNYLIKNKHLYIIHDWNQIGFINTLEYLPNEFKKNINPNLSNNYHYWIKEKQYTNSNGKIITPFRRPYSDNAFVLFTDFLEEIKEIWKQIHPDAIKVIIRKQGLKRFFGITDINPETNYYNLSQIGRNEPQFQETIPEYLFLFQDGTLKGFK
jgi:hypothetical protein